ncbi:MAG TPA: hypothetical protein VFH63_04165 [candidate division Zixibacteria bacterium]|nr:hypothetical protein [candidate division Zixibacteria bacterium]
MVFGRRRQKADAEAAREAERRALFEELAKRPDTVCPFLGLAEARTQYHDGVSDDHRCYAFGDPAELSAEQQQKVCLQRGYGNCPRYLRGVLVIPTEELEALRRPQPLPAPPEPVAPEPAAAGSGRRGRGGLVAVALVVLLAVLGGGAGAVFLLGGDGNGTGLVTPTPQSSPPSTATPAPPSASATSQPQTEAPSATPVETPPPEATPEPEDTFVGYEVSVPRGENTVFTVNDAGEITDQKGAFFDDWSFATVEEVEAPNGLRHWRTTTGPLAGWSYIKDESGTFYIRAVYRGADGSRRSEILPEDEL